MLSSQSYHLLVTVKAFGCMKITSVEDRSLSSRDLIRRKGFPNQMNSELELKSSEHKTYTECQKRKLCSDTEMSLEKTPKKRVSLQGRQRESEKELVVLKHHHSDYGRKDKIGKSVLRSKMDHTSNTNERVKEKLPVKLDKKSYRETEGAPRRVATIISSREQASIALLQPTKLPGTCSRANNSLERPTDYYSSRKIGCKGQVKSQRIKAESVQGKMHRSAKEMAYPLQSSNMNCSDVKMKLHSSDKNGSIVLPMLLYRSQGKKESSKDSPQISKEPVHVYEEIDNSLVVHKKVEKKEDTFVTYQSEVKVQKKKLKSKVLQTSVSSPQDPEAPELPYREYLTDIDFVAQEFDLLLTRAPELPKRMEDSTNTLTSTDVMVDDKTTAWTKHTKMQRHGTQQSLIRQELELISVGMNPKSAPPKVHNIIKESKALVDVTQPQNKKEEIGHKFPREIKQKKSRSEFKHCASSANQQPPQKPTGARPLPCRQPMRAEQLLQPVTGNQDWDTCPTYQNVTEECTYDAVDYQNVTGDAHNMAQGNKMSYQNIYSKQKQQIREETSTYQPLIFHCADTKEDEYMEMDFI